MRVALRWEGADCQIDYGLSTTYSNIQRLNRGTGAVRKQDMGILTEDYRNLGPRQKTCTLENRDPGQPRTIPFGWVLCRESELANLWVQISRPRSIRRGQNLTAISPCLD